LSLLLGQETKMKPVVQDRRAYIVTEARRLARSGEHFSSKSILAVFLGSGFREANRVFANRWTRSELDRICEQALVNRKSAA
jgi:hypothetical protein